MAVFATVVLAVGYFMRTTFGRLAESAVDGAINRIPALRVVYNASKLAIETAVSGTDELQSPVYIETWPGIRMTAFRTGKKTRDGKIVLFMPTAPNITTGFVIEVEPSASRRPGRPLRRDDARPLGRVRRVRASGPRRGGATARGDHRAAWGRRRRPHRRNPGESDRPSTDGGGEGD